jgi:hypothetical protein
MKRILIVGCSFSHQIKIENDVIENCWVDYISKEYDYIHTMNLSVPGASNELIKRIVTKKVLEENWDHVIIQWSTIDRWDYPQINPQHTTFVKYQPMGSNLEGNNELFYKNYYSVYGAVIDTLENILFIQQLLESESMSYSMITIGNLFTLSTTVGQIRNLMTTGGDYLETRENVLEVMERMQFPFEDTDSLPFLLKKINYNNFCFTDDIRNPMGGGMLEWLYNEKNDYPRINWHFDAKQSYNFFNEFIKPNILIKNGIINN